MSPQERAKRLVEKYKEFSSSGVPWNWESFERELALEIESHADEYVHLHAQMAIRLNALEHRLGQIAMILRDDMTEKPIRDF